MKWFIKIWFENNYEWRENISVETRIWKIPPIPTRVGVEVEEGIREEAKIIVFSSYKELKTKNISITRCELVDNIEIFLGQLSYGNTLEGIR